MLAGRAVAAACTLALIAGCGDSTSGPSTLRRPPSSYLLTVDQLVAPNFTIDAAAHPLSAADIAAGDQARATQLATSGLIAGAGEDFFRPAANIALANGPVQIGDTVEQFATAAGAITVFAGDVTRLDAVPGARAVSTGGIGDAAHATTRLVTVPGSGVHLIEISVEWRVDNLIDLLVVRGRDGGTRADDALFLAHRQTATELGLATPTPLPPSSPSPSSSPGRP
ncbi:MAG: hypothetical protein JF887_14440 [Candidatus Dormibacteraeota bacterium]|uniref:Uncharacterized protein n=1 Tax=Candidatus Amunia macphersoniae TaxID=3127014 RepID=A0A934KG40_9BACT|nr:hypothetical protein [Candidatus Dormibacteraeota bacterium]